MKQYVKFGSLFANSLLSVAIAAGMATLEGCGGGGGGPAASTGATDQLQSQAGAPTLAEGVTGTAGDSGTPTGGVPVTGSGGAPTGSITGGTTTPVPETTSGTLGYLAPTGTVISGADGAIQWRFSSTKTLAYSAGSVSTDGSGSVLLNFDFGCQTSTIVVRQSDCRNSVSARRLLPFPVSVSGKSMLSIDVRNVDASANFAVMLWDSTGQVLRYPLSLRSIESRGSNAVQRVYVQLNKPSSYWAGANDGVLHGNIAAIAVSAQPLINDFATGGLNYPAGTLAFGDIRLHAASSFDYNLQVNAQRVASAYTSYKGRLAISSTLEPVYLDKALQAGISTIRRDLNWEGAERAGQFNFTYLLNFMPDVQSRGMKVLWILDYGHPDHGGTTPQTAADRQAYATFAQAAATAFKGKPVLAYELWNEPDSSIYWTSPDPVAFADMVARATTGIKSADSTAKVVTGGVVLGPDLSYLYKLAGQTTKLSQVDAIGVHPYRFDSFTYTSPTYKRVSNSPESYAADQAVLSRLLSAAGSTKPMWDTEAGYSSYLFLDSTRYGNGLDARARNRQGNLTLRRVLTQLAIDAPLITLFNLYDTTFNATDREHNFGLLDADLNEKPAFVALKNLYSSVGQLTFRGYHSDVPPHTHALRWDNTTTGARVFVVWNDDPDFSTTVTLPAGVTAVKSWTGGVVTPVMSMSGAKQVVLTEEAGPVFVFVN